MKRFAPPVLAAYGIPLNVRIPRAKYPRTLPEVVSTTGLEDEAIMSGSCDSNARADVFGDAEATDAAEAAKLAPASEAAFWMKARRSIPRLPFFRRIIGYLFSHSPIGREFTSSGFSGYSSKRRRGHYHPRGRRRGKYGPMHGMVANASVSLTVAKRCRAIRISSFMVLSREMG